MVRAVAVMNDRAKKILSPGPIIGVGSALVDILLKADDAYVDRVGAAKGGMQLVDQKVIDEALSLTEAKPIRVPGGSACNTVLGVGMLGGDARFIGKIGNDDLAPLFRASLEKHHVQPVLISSDLPTGRVLSIITPDAQRSMLTYLGASQEMRPSEISSQLFEGAAVVHIEGYQLFNPELMLAMLKAAQKAGAAISLDLASYTVVEASRELLADIIKRFVTILIANEDEAQALTGLSAETAAVKALGDQAPVGVLKVGAKGSYIRYQNTTHRIDPIGTGAAVDTTGAGDLWAAGFLFGLVNGFELPAAGALASACGYEVCQVVGATIPAEGWQRIKKGLTH
jgi:sugar/nucleoside kinase (ribokinase family)